MLSHLKMEEILDGKCANQKVAGNKEEEISDFIIVDKRLNIEKTEKEDENPLNCFRLHVVFHSEEEG